MLDFKATVEASVNNSGRWMIINNDIMSYSKFESRLLSRDLF